MRRRNPLQLHLTVACETPWEGNNLVDDSLISGMASLMYERRHFAVGDTPLGKQVRPANAEDP